MNQIWLRSASKLHFKDPEKFLRQLRVLEYEVVRSDLPQNVKALRGNELKVHRESREAALFCHGIGSRLGMRVEFARDESQDYDFVARILSENRTLLIPVQIKEVVPTELNPEGTLEDIINSLEKTYVDSADLTVVIHLNRQIRFDPDQVRDPPLKLGGLWIFGAISSDQNIWALWGDFLSQASGTQFEYPAP